MTLTQSWVGYLDRSYEQIKRSLLTKLSTSAPEITDYSETNPLIIIVSMFSGLAEVLNLYIDSNAREAFLGVCRRYSSAVRLVKLIDYQIKARNPASANILFTLRDTDGNVTTYTSSIVLQKGLVVTAQNSNVPYVLISNTTLPAGSQSVYGQVLQYETITGDILGNTNGTTSQKFGLTPKYVNGSLKITIDGQSYPLYNSFGLMGPSTKGCVVNIDEEGNAYVEFGDSTNGVIPPSGKTVYADYQECEGASGNQAPNTLNNIVDPGGLLPAIPNITISANNPDYASGGTNFQGLEDIRDRAPRSIRTLDRAVTYQDYIDVALQVMGVGAAEVKYCCGKYVDLYIAPSSKGVATLALVNTVQQYMNCKVMVTTRVSVSPAGASRIWIKATIIGKPLYTEAQIQKELLDAWDVEFGPGNIKINRRVSITDIIAVGEALKTVDTVQIEKVKIEPYARPINETTSILNITWNTLPTNTVSLKYKLIKTSGDSWQLYKSGVFISNVVTNTPYTDGSIIGFTILDGIYNTDDTFEFTVFPSYPEIFPVTNIDIKDYSAPIIDISPLISDALPRTIFSDLTFQTQGTSSSCLPACN